MALRLTIPTSLRSITSSSSSSSSSSSGGRRRTEIRPPVGGIKQKSNNRLPISSSPLQRTYQEEEEIITDFCLESTIVELERLFRKGERKRSSRRPPQNPSPSPPRDNGRPLRVAYQGVRGSYCQEAALKAFSSTSSSSFPCNQMEDAFDALEDNSADRAIIPVENSIDGTIDRNFDLLLRHHQVEIVGELILPVNHCLLVVPGTRRSQLKRIVSHPQALSHCETKLHSLDLEVDEVSSAAEAAQFVSANWIPDTAVIGSKVAAKEFGLQVLEQNFQDQNGNFNRFLQLGLKKMKKSSSSSMGMGAAWKTTVAFSLEKGASDLFRALWVFESRNIRVTKVEHRPNRSNPVLQLEKKTGNHLYLDYIFILDLQLDLNANVSESDLISALSGLEEISSFIRILGSYATSHNS